MLWQKFLWQKINSLQIKFCCLQWTPSWTSVLIYFYTCILVNSFLVSLLVYIFNISWYCLVSYIKENLIIHKIKKRYDMLHTKSFVLFQCPIEIFCIHNMKVWPTFYDSWKKVFHFYPRYFTIQLLTSEAAQQFT